MLQIPKSEQYDKNLDRTNDNFDAYPCVVCGRKVPKRRWFLLVDSSLKVAYKRSEYEQLCPSGQMGGYPVGPDCLRRHPELKEYALDWKGIDEPQ